MLLATKDFARGSWPVMEMMAVSKHDATKAKFRSLGFRRILI